MSRHIDILSCMYYDKVSDQAHVPSEDWAIFIEVSQLKPFSTYQQQIDTLKSRGLIIVNDMETTISRLAI